MHAAARRDQSIPGRAVISSASDRADHGRRRGGHAVRVRQVALALLWRPRCWAWAAQPAHAATTRRSSWTRRSTTVARRQKRASAAAARLAVSVGLHGRFCRGRRYAGPSVQRRRVALAPRSEARRLVGASPRPRGSTKVAVAAGMSLRAPDRHAGRRWQPSVDADVVPRRRRIAFVDGSLDRPARRRRHRGRCVRARPEFDHRQRRATSRGQLRRRRPTFIGDHVDGVASLVDRRPEPPPGHAQRQRRLRQPASYLRSGMRRRQARCTTDTYGSVLARVPDVPLGRAWARRVLAPARRPQPRRRRSTWRAALRRVPTVRRRRGVSAACTWSWITSARMVRMSGRHPLASRGRSRRPAGRAIWAICNVWLSRSSPVGASVSAVLVEDDPTCRRRQRRVADMILSAAQVPALGSPSSVGARPYAPLRHGRSTGCRFWHA